MVHANTEADCHITPEVNRCWRNSDSFWP